MCNTTLCRCADTGDFPVSPGCPEEGGWKPEQRLRVPEDQALTTWPQQAGQSIISIIGKVFKVINVLFDFFPTHLIYYINFPRFIGRTTIFKCMHFYCMQWRKRVKYLKTWRSLLFLPQDEMHTCFSFCSFRSVPARIGVFFLLFKCLKAGVHSWICTFQMTTGSTIIPSEDELD